MSRISRISASVRARSSKAAGWTDEALYDAISVCALFNFYNVWIDATGVHDMPAAGYTMTGKRLAGGGYVWPSKPDGDPNAK